MQRTSVSEKKNVLENKILTLESERNSLEQYGRRNNIEITGIPGSAPDQNLEEKVVDILNEKSVTVSPKDIEACHCVGVQLKENNSSFYKQKACKESSYKQKKSEEKLIT